MGSARYIPLVNSHLANGMDVSYLLARKEPVDLNLAKRLTIQIVCSIAISRKVTDRKRQKKRLRQIRRLRHIQL